MINWQDIDNRHIRYGWHGIGLTALTIAFGCNTYLLLMLGHHQLSPQAGLDELLGRLCPL